MMAPSESRCSFYHRDSFVNRPADNREAAGFSNARNDIKLVIAEMLPSSDMNALSCTCSASSNPLTTYMCRRAMVELPETGMPYFFRAASRGCLAAASLFIELGVDAGVGVFGDVEGEMSVVDGRVYGFVDTGHTVLLVAMQGGHDCEPMVRLLIDAGADMYDSCAHFPTALRKAISTRAMSVTEFLMDRGANPNIVPENGQTLLHVAA